MVDLTRRLKYFAQSCVNISIDYRLQLENILLVYVDFSLEMHFACLKRLEIGNFFDTSSDFDSDFP